MTDKVELWGGPLDGREVGMHPLMNMVFFMETYRDGSPIPPHTQYTPGEVGWRHWYRYEPGTGRARYVESTAPRVFRV